MGQETKINWTSILDTAGNEISGSTFSPWEGCAKVSAGCANCYAEGQHNLYFSALKGEGQPGTCWGVSAPRLARAEAYWKAPLRWNALAQAAQTAGLETSRRRVFCASMADVFEDQPAASRAHAGTFGTVPTGNGSTRRVRFVDIAAERLRLLRLIYETPALDWLLLTKRPGNIVPALEAAHNTLAGIALRDLTEADDALMGWLYRWLHGIQAPVNVWLGTSVEHQQAADERVTALLDAPAALHFLSCEPLLGPVDLTALPRPYDAHPDSYPVGRFDALDGRWHPIDGFEPGYVRSRINWVIVGGESGPRARLQEADWVRSLQDQCRQAGVPFLFKQMGTVWSKNLNGTDKHGAKLDEIPAEFQVRESPSSRQRENERAQPKK